MLSRKKFNQEFVRSLQFLSVSFVSALSNILYIALLSHFTSLPFWFVSLTSTEFSMVVNFILNDRFTFRNLQSNRVWYVRLARFQVAALGGNLLTAVISTFLHDVASLSPIVAQVVAIILTFFVNFVVHRFWTFKGRSDTAGASGASGASDASGASGASLSKATWDDASAGYVRGEAGGGDGPRQPRIRVNGVSVIIPVCNEAATVRPLLTRLHAAMTAVNLPYEALIIDDHSTDDTAKVAAVVIDEHQIPAQVLMKRGKPGKSYSLMEGFDAARYPVLAMIDGDLELPPEALPDMVRALARYDVVVGRRLEYSKNNSLRGQISATFNSLVLRLFLGINFEVQTGIKVFWKHVYEAMELTPGQWGFDMEFVAKALADGFRIGEYDVPFQKRQAGVSKVNPVVVAVELITSAFRIKLGILQSAKANATLKVRAVSPARASVPIMSLNSALPVVIEWLIPLALLYVFLYKMMGQAFLSSEHFLGLPGDTNQYMWFIGWIWRAIEAGHSPLVSGAFNYPSPINIMDYTSVPLVGLLFGWLYAFTSVVFVYNLIILANYTLIFVFGKLTLRALGIGSVLSGVGALLFCLLPYITVQDVGHLNLAFIAPLFVVGYLVAHITRSGRRPGWALGLITGLALTLAFYTFLETFLTVLLCIAIVYGCALLCAFKPTYQLTMRLLNLPFLLGLVAPLFLIIPGLLNFVQGEGPQPLDFTFMATVYSNDALSLILPSQYYFVHSYATTLLTSQFTGNPTEWDGYLSVPLIVLVVVYAVRGWNKPRTRILTLASASMIVLSFGPYLHIGGVQTHVSLPWKVILHIPFIRDALPSRLGLYAAYLAVILVVWGVDESVKQAQVRQRTLKQVSEWGLNLAALALVALLWLPLIPNFSAPMPEAATILRTDQVVPRYVSHDPTLVLYEQDYGFSVVMGILAASNNYGLVTSNVYGHTMADTTSYKLDEAFIHDTDGKQTDAALRQYLPQLGVGKVMFISIDDQPMSEQQVTEISRVLGAPVYNNQGLVVVWNVPQGISAQGTTPSARICERYSNIGHSMV